MALKPRHRRRIFWGIICTIIALVMAMIFIPPMITLNSLKPMVEKSVAEQTNVPAKLNGDIHFSLIGGATIVAHDVNVPTAHIGSVIFSIPFRSFFDIKNARLNGPVVVYDADITIDKLAPAFFNHNIELYNSDINFMGRKFHIVRADFTDNEFHGIIRTAEHKYDVEFSGDTFKIVNKNDKLEIRGQMFSDGSIRGHISVETDHINEWFNIQKPKITKTVKLDMDFEWNGGNGYKFTNITADNVSGNIEIFPNGDKDIQLVSNDLNMDFSFLLATNDLINRTKLNLDFYGDLTFMRHKFHHLRIQATGTNNAFQIANIIADNIAITGGTITGNGAKNLMITMPINKTPAMCLFSGTPKKWECSKFSYGNISGSLSVDGDTFYINMESNKKMPTDDQLLEMVKRFGTNGIIKFRFSDIAGTYKISPSGITPSYSYAQNKTLKWLNIDMPFLPDFIRNAPGNFSWNKDMLTFAPHNKQWQLSMYDNYFHLTGKNYKTWLPIDMDTRFLRDGAYSISGFYDKNRISNLNIKISGHEFSGSASGQNITLNTTSLDLESFINPEFTKNAEQMEFLANAPVLTLFNLPLNISLSANTLIYNGNSYKNFLYSLKQNSQTFSITDAERGNLLATVERDKSKYNIFAQLNRFVINGKLLSPQMPLNIRDTMITGQIVMNTSGQIANDIYYNMSGDIDLTFYDGYLIGLGTDEFYASAKNITRLNAERALARALTGGETKIKEMRIVGTYSDGNFISTEAINLSARHTDIIGGMAITDGLMTAEFDIIMRGTAPDVATIELGILPNGGHQYSLSDIMQNIDINFMRAFIETHDRF